MKLWNLTPRKEKSEHEFLESIFEDSEVTTDDYSFQIVTHDCKKDRLAVDELIAEFGYRMVCDPVHHGDGVDTYWVRKK